MAPTSPASGVPNAGGGHATSTPITVSHWLHFFKEFPRIVLKVEANQRYVRMVNKKRLVADVQPNKMFEEQPVGVSGWTSWKYMFIAEWRHKGQPMRSSRPPSADASEDCVALKASNGMYLSVEQKDGSLSLVCVASSPCATEDLPPHCIRQIGADPA